MAGDRLRRAIAGAWVVEEGEEVGAVVPIQSDRTTSQNRPFRSDMLAHDDQAETVEPAERGQIGLGEGSVVHVEVFWMASVGTSIIRGSRSPSPPGPRPATYTLIRKDPDHVLTIGDIMQHRKVDERDIVTEEGADSFRVAYIDSNDCVEMYDVDCDDVEKVITWATEHFRQAKSKRGGSYYIAVRQPPHNEPLVTRQGVSLIWLTPYPEGL